jgi:hypothetical protein
MPRQPFVPRHPSALGLPDVVWRYELGPELRAEEKKDPKGRWSYMKWDKFTFDRIDVVDSAIRPDYPLTYQSPGWTLTIEKRPSVEKLREFRLKRGWWPFEFYRTHSYVHEYSAPMQRDLFEPEESHSLTSVFADDVLHPDLRGGYHSASRTVQIDESELRRIGLAAYEYTVKPAFVSVLNYAMRFPPFAGGRAVKIGRGKR